jgi:hypothetical protein
MTIRIKDFATNVEIDANTAAGTEICSTNSGQMRLFTSLSIMNTSSSVSTWVSIFRLDTADLPINTSITIAVYNIRPLETWNALAVIGALTLGPSQSLYALPLNDSILFATAGGYEQT